MTNERTQPEGGARRPDEGWRTMMEAMRGDRGSREEVMGRAREALAGCCQQGGIATDSTAADDPGESVPETTTGEDR